MHIYFHILKVERRLITEVSPDYNILVLPGIPTQVG